MCIYVNICTMYVYPVKTYLGVAGRYRCYQVDLPRYYCWDQPLRMGQPLNSSYEIYEIVLKEVINIHNCSW